jgi:hypothetical protein
MNESDKEAEKIIEKARNISKLKEYNKINVYKLSNSDRYNNIVPIRK